MKFDEFKLERWLSETRFNCDIDLSASVITHFKYSELISEKDLDVPVRIGPTNGTEALREEISKLYPDAVKTEGIMITHGAAEANFLLLNHLVSAGDECIFVVPNYMQAYGILKAIGAKVKLLHLNDKKEYCLDIDEVKESFSKKTKAILITNPNNPTGARLTDTELKTVCDIAKSAGAYVICDEVLSGLELDGRRTASPVEIYEKGISTRSVSKLGLSGLRVGWIVARDPKIAQKCWAIRDYTSLGNSFFNQNVAVIALRNLEKIMRRNREILNDRAKILMKAVEKSENSINCVKPQAGSTALISYNVNVDSVAFCRKLSTKERVVVSPGDYFEAPKGFRLLYGTDAKKLKEGLTRITRFAKTEQVN